ncbi:Uncharacterized protein HZ326_24010 [Fusarium oxysporum f. sp. albedinis]|nr:Uncharacterized protein HZ326_24010 [Fusarium oxysporum f. sp. albedinis]
MNLPCRPRKKPALVLCIYTSILIALNKSAGLTVMGPLISIIIDRQLQGRFDAGSPLPQIQNIFWVVKGAAENFIVMNLIWKISRLNPFSDRSIRFKNPILVSIRAISKDNNLLAILLLR